MNAISMPTMAGAATATIPGLRLPDMRVARLRPSAEWLPVPAAPSRTLTQRRRPAGSAGIWVHPPRQHNLERILYALVSAAAVIAIGYGFSCLIELVQHWALFQGGIANLVQ